MTRISKLIILALAAALALAGCASSPVEEVPELLEPVGVKVDAAVVTRGDICSLTAHEGAVVAVGEGMHFEIDGTLAPVTIYPGKWVTKGEVLLTIDQSALKERIDALERQIDYETQNGADEDELMRLDGEILRLRLETLKADPEADPQAVTLAELDIEQNELKRKQAAETRELNLSALRADLNELRKDWGRNTIVAPFDGHVFYEAPLHEDTYVQAYKDIIYMANPDDLRLQITDYLSDTRVGSTVVYALIDGGRYEVEYDPMSREEMTAMILSGQSLITRFKIIVPEGQEGKVTAGQYASLIMEANRYEDVLTVPSAAVYTGGGARYVYVIRPDGSRERRTVETGRSNGVDTIITSGLEEGETVYVKE